MIAKRWRMVATATLFPLLASSLLAAQISGTVPMAPNSKVITTPGPQRPQPPGRQQPAGSGRAQVAPAPLRVEMNPGTVEGFVYWDADQMSHIPAASCSGLAITVSVGSSSGGPLVSYTPMATLSNNFKFIGRVQGVSGGKTVTYEVCAFGYDHVPVGPNLQVKLSITQPMSFSPIASPQVEILGPISIVNGQCNMLPRIMNPTVADLTGHWGSCQNMAYGVSFALVHPQMLHTLSSSGGSGGMLGGSAASGTLLNHANTSPALAISPTAPTGNAGTPARQSGGSNAAVQPGVKNAGDLNPQPYPLNDVATKAQTPPRNIVSPLPATPPKAGRKLTNARAAQHEASIVAVLRQQHQVATQEYAAMKIEPRPAMTAVSKVGSVGSVGPERAMDSTISSRASLAPQMNTTVITCTKDPIPRILKVSGSTGPGVLTPEGKYNLYTIVGCSFGPSRPGNAVHIYGANGFKENLNIDFWNENGITVHFDPSLAGVLDQDNVTLVIAPAGRQPFQKSGFKFYAARGIPGPDGNPQEVQLNSFPQSSIALGDFSPVPSAYDSVTKNSGTKYRFFWSFKDTPVAAWVFRYSSGHGDLSSLRTAECFIDDVAYNDDNLCTAFGIGRYAGGFESWKTQSDSWNLTKLVPGFYVSSYQLFTDNPDPATLCGSWDDLSGSKVAQLNGSWDFNLTSENQISVNWGLNSCFDHEANFAGRNNIVVESSYGLAVWVLGPRCVDPWTGQADQQCMAMVRSVLGS